MSDSTRDQLDDALAELRQALPSMRLGQLIANMAMVAGRMDAGAVWDVEDDELLAAIRWQLDELAGRAVAETAPQAPLAPAEAAYGL